MKAQRNLNDLSKEEKAKLMRQEFEKKSPFEILLPNQSSTKINCEKFYHKFRNKIADLLVTKGIVKEVNFPLEELHMNLPQEMKDYNLNDGVNKITTFFMKMMQNLRKFI